MIQLLVFATVAGSVFGYSPRYNKYRIPSGAGLYSRHSHLSGGVGGPFLRRLFSSEGGLSSRFPLYSGGGSSSRYPYMSGGGSTSGYPYYSRGPSSSYPYSSGEGSFSRFSSPSTTGSSSRYLYPQGEMSYLRPGEGARRRPQSAAGHGSRRRFQYPSGSESHYHYHYPSGGGLHPGHPFHPEEHDHAYLPNIRCWTPWFDRDDPDGAGDCELLAPHQRENPGLICPRPTAIDVSTVYGESVASKKEVIHQKNATGFVCRNKDQPDNRCCDYRVRFACYAPFCDQVCSWTRWYDRDDCDGTGDWELLRDLLDENPGEICPKPIAIEAVTVDTMTPAIHTGDFLHVYDPCRGLVCRAEDQPNHRCNDYKVRFGCPC